MPCHSSFYILETTINCITVLWRTLQRAAANFSSPSRTYRVRSRAGPCPANIAVRQTFSSSLLGLETSEHPARSTNRSIRVHRCSSAAINDKVPLPPTPLKIMIGRRSHPSRVLYARLKALSAACWLPSPSVRFIAPRYPSVSAGPGGTTRMRRSNKPERQRIAPAI